ncbi:ankyrin [Cylindrobasidium torrendii FP15055 ss-10]|uniref:Ankyrin n=1 Tax=Cylindrobasidium torrendii FP15055 ss-10 TaxID=1314674 RepID=A0A0D7BU16_9AGAR|nr:ankyrin [Cylindrobasidium torrendii FP15055 ss-10]
MSNALPAETIQFAHRMFDAARNGDSELLLAAVKGGLPANLTNDQGNTLLMLAAYAGHTELARELIAMGADANRLNDRGQSILAGAVFKGNEEMVKVLVEGGADPRLGQPSAVESAVMFGKKEMISILGADESEVGSHVPRPVS